MVCFGAIHPEDSPKTEPKDVLVSIYVLNIGKYDISTGSFTADFYLDMKHDADIDPTNFEFANGRATNTDTIIATPTEHFYRIQADLVSPVDLKNFPFDNQKLQIIIEDKKNTLAKLRYVPWLEQTQLDKSVIFVGWNIKNWSASTRIHDYPKWKEQYSQFVFDINISRIAISSFMKTFLPVIFIITIALASLTIHPTQQTFITRLTMSTTCLIGAVMFHVSISNQIPPVGYLTFADKFMVVTYFLILYIFISIITIILLDHFKKTEQVQRVNQISKIGALIIVPVAFLALFYYGL